MRLRSLLMVIDYRTNVICHCHYKNELWQSEEEDVVNCRDALNYLSDDFMDSFIDIVYIEKGTLHITSHIN